MPKPSSVASFFHSFPIKSPVFLSNSHLTLKRCHSISIPLSLLISCHHFLMHLLMKSLNSCMPLIITMWLRPYPRSPPKTSFCQYYSCNNNDTKYFLIYRYFPHSFSAISGYPLLKKLSHDKDT